ncbi:uncharacterized protein LOC115801341 [Archocentrus centrarchus]|uniref:uncharacterized protein LOC115801341 n=1 Tax=Archocentrus centrarchus TaxID=63155 RepID=UPI0011E9BACC|nr:uncharacterized protein LOC115801341 [Archocentrus centrarchus]
MLPGLILLFILFERTVKSQAQSMYSTHSTTTAVTPRETIPPLDVVAIPNYPVAAGEKISLYCSTPTTSESVTWSWKHQQNQTWKEVGSGKELTLTKPEQSGEYRCCAKRQMLQKCTNNTHTVYIISVQARVGENLGIAAFFFSLLSLILIIAVVFWLGFQKPGQTPATSNTAAKGFPGPQMTSKGDLPQPDKDVYMNYTSTNQYYVDLDPTNMTGDNVYSSLP